MKRIILIFFVALTIIACNNSINDQDKQDSITAARAADSMLKAATEVDTMETDKTAVDSATTDSLKNP